jgi:hypothetical protein
MTNANEVDSDGKSGIDVVDTARKTLVYVLCNDCDEIDEMLIVEDTQDSNQTQEVTETYSSIMEKHSDKTGHRIQMGITERYEIDLVHIARAITS